MWLARMPVAADVSAGQVTTGMLVAGGIALLSAALAAWLGSRGMLRTADAQREANFEKRIDERNAHLEKRNEELIVELHRCREQYARLRRGVINAGLDPNQVMEEGDP